MSSLCSKLSMAPYITQTKILSLYHDLQGSTLFVPNYRFDLLSLSPLSLILVASLFLSQAQHTPISGSWCLQLLCLECCSPQVFRMGWSLTPFYCLLTYIREAFSNHSKTAITTCPPSIFFTITSDLWCLLPLEWKPRNFVVFTAVSPALRMVLLVLSKDLLNNQIHILFTSA